MVNLLAALGPLLVRFCKSRRFDTITLLTITLSLQAVVFIFLILKADLGAGTSFLVWCVSFMDYVGLLFEVRLTDPELSSPLVDRSDCMHDYYFLAVGDWNAIASAYTGSLIITAPLIVATLPYMLYLMRIDLHERKFCFTWCGASH